jgi:hypothetical protein
MSDPKLFTIRGIQFGLYGSSYNHISDEYEWRFAIARGADCPSRRHSLNRSLDMRSQA